MDEPFDTNEIPDVVLSNDERAHLAALVTSPTWTVLTEKVWKHLRRMAVTSLIRGPVADYSRVQGYYSGLQTAEFAVIKCSQPPKAEFSPIGPLESKLTPRSSSGGSL